jgi:hypothetical protein
VVNAKTLVIVGLVTLVAGFSVIRLWPSDIRAIRVQLAVIEEAGSKERGEPQMEGLFKARQLAELFNDPCRLTVETIKHEGVYPRRQIQDRIAMVRASFAVAKVALHDVVIDLSAKDLAVVRATIRLKGTQTGEPMADVQELRAEMGKHDGRWLFTAVTIVEVLER